MRTPSLCVFLLALGCLLWSCEGDDGKDGKIITVPLPGDGLNIIVHSVELSSGGVTVVEFSLEDDEGAPLSIADLDSNPSFQLGWIDVDALTGRTRYQSHILRQVDGQPFEYNGMAMQPALADASQATSDSGGELEELPDFVYRYTFGTRAAPGIDMDATHTMSMYATRESREFIANAVVDFVPSGDPVTVTREITTRTACNECHSDLSAHGGQRREVGMCQVCHTDQTIDPESGNSCDFGVMIHKIHYGAELSNHPYFIVGRQQSIHDFSEVHFPMDARSCTKCHKDGSESDFWKTKPSRSACGACHDDVNFATGENHQGIVQMDDSQCTNCHQDTMMFEFDNSIPGAHVIPYQSSSNPDLTLAIVDVQNMTPGNQPSIRFTIQDNTDGDVNIASLNRVAVVFAGPTNDYSQLLAGNGFTIQGGGAGGTLITNAVGDYTFMPNGYMLPMSATGTWSVGMEARTTGITVGTQSISFGANNPVVHIDVNDGTLGGGAAMARREIVDEANCNQCHGDVIAHGNLRTEIQYCVMCHNTWATDETRRPNLDPVTNPPESIHFKYMIHKIHRGAELENGYTVYGFGSTAHDFTEVHFPGDLTNCEQCHVDMTYLLPLAMGTQPTVVNIAGTVVPQPDAILPPTSAACTSCHDGDSSKLHARLNSFILDPVIWGESCDVCHGEGKPFAVSESHGR